MIMVERLYHVAHYNRFIFLLRPSQNKPIYPKEDLSSYRAGIKSYKFCFLLNLSYKKGIDLTMLSILRKARLKDKEMRILMLYADP